MPDLSRVIIMSQRGFTLIELMIVVAIIGVLASVAIPSMNYYTQRSRFAEGVMAVTVYKHAQVIAIEVRDPPDLASLNAGSYGIPPAITQTASAHGVTVIGGTVQFTWMADGTVLDGVTYTLEPSGLTPPIQWTSGGSCVSAGYC